MMAGANATRDQFIQFTRNHPSRIDEMMADDYTKWTMGAEICANA